MVGQYKLVTPEDLIGLLDSPQDGGRVAIIDCRDDDRSEGWIINSIHMPNHAYTPQSYRELATALHEQKKLYAVFHCFASYSRGPRGARRFSEAQLELGYTLPAVYVLHGGWEAFHMVYGQSRDDLVCYSVDEEQEKQIQLVRPANMLHSATAREETSESAHQKQKPPQRKRWSSENHL